MALMPFQCAIKRRKTCKLRNCHITNRGSIAQHRPHFPTKHFEPMDAKMTSKKISRRMSLQAIFCFIVHVSVACSQEPSAALPNSTEIETPVTVVTPAGHKIDLAGMRPQVLALSPDGKSLVTSGKTNKLIVIDPETRVVRQSVDFPAKDQTKEPDVASPNILKPDAGSLVSYTGLVYSADGKRLYMSNVTGSIKVFSVAIDGTHTPSYTIPLPDAKAPRRPQEIPSGLAIDESAGKLLVCGNLSNSLIVINLADGSVDRKIPVGVAPYDVVIHNNKAFVSNWGGRIPDSDSLTGPAGKGTTVRVDPVRHIANEGSVSIIDLKTWTTETTMVGLSPTDLAVSPNGKFIVCANTNSDSLSILSSESGKVLETVFVNAKQSDIYGAAPNALAFNAKGDTLFVANGSQNAIAVMSFDPDDKGETILKGLIPVGWYPGAVSFDAARNQVCVANLKGLPAKPSKIEKSQGYNSHQHNGSISIVPLPTTEQLAILSEQVAKNMRRNAIRDAALPPRPNQPARPIPERIGEPSTIEHVVYVIKENRTYDQIFGDIERGNGDPGLCIFGRNITPNQHRMVDQFVLLDNTYCCGILSADGHNWTTSALSNAYLEKSFAGFPRSYPDGMGDDEADALAYSPAGFIWDNAVLHRKTIRNYGEFMKPKVRFRDTSKKGKPDYMACFRTWKGADEVIFESEPAIESIRDYSPKDYVGWSMEVPDQARADFILKELAEFEKKGNLPNLILICLPNDHTNGTSAKSPTPAAYMADNDLAFARIVEGLSHSKFWPKMAIFGIEDDPQNGWDHVSGYRTTAYCISPYAKRQQTISTRYNTTSILRTMEQILGLPPMNQFDAGATPMFDCFQETPDLTPFDSVAIEIPLDQLNTPLALIVDPVQRHFAEQSATINFAEIDKAPEDLLNRILWNAMKANQPYPEWAITASEDDDDEDAEEEKVGNESRVIANEK